MMDLGKLNQLAVHRVCPFCQREFDSDKEHRALEKFCDHLTEHQPTPQQWHEAHKKIAAAKNKGTP
jgi:hypothetical protein